MENFAEVNLHPLSLGEILDTAIRLYRRNFWLFVGVITLAEIPLLLVQVLLPFLYTKGAGEDFFSLHWWVINGVNFLLRWIFVDGIGTLALGYAISQRYLRQPTALLDVYRRVGGSLPGLLGVFFVVPGLLLVVTIWGLVPCLGWVSSMGIYIFLNMAVLPFVPLVLVIERQNSLQSILRAWDLARRRFFWLIFFNIMLAVFSWILVAGPSLVASGLATALLDKTVAGSAETWYPLIWSVAGTLFNMLFLPIEIGAWTLTYYDVRVRSEAFDLALLVTDAPEDTNQLVQLPPLEKWFSWGDIVRLVSISLGMVAIFVSFYLLWFAAIGFLLLLGALAR